MPRRVLVIEDEAEIADLLHIHLRDLGYVVDVARDGAQGIDKCQSKRYDLIMLDLMLPGADGLEICRRIRADSKYTPVIMLTARSSELERVLGLEMGADDYVTKPFSIPELLARVKAVFRREDSINAAAQAQDMRPLRRGNLVIDIGRREVSVNGRLVDLSAKEFDLLLHLSRNAGHAYTRTELLDAVWGYSYDGFGHTLNNHINRLRAKIETEPKQPQLILTVWGVGYKFADTKRRKPQE